MYKVNKKDEVPIYLFHQGTNFKAYEFMGSHSSKRKGVSGAVFRVWAPHAHSVSVVGDFNSWDRSCDPMEKISENGLWEGFVRRSSSTTCISTASKPHRGMWY